MEFSAACTGDITIAARRQHELMLKAIYDPAISTSPNSSLQLSEQEFIAVVFVDFRPKY